MNIDIKFCLECSRPIPIEEELCTLTQKLCFNCRQPFAKENHFSKCQSCLNSMTTPRLTCSICKTSFSSKSKLNPPNCLTHSFCSICTNNKANTLYNFVDDKGIFSVSDHTGAYCNNCFLYFDSFFNTYKPPNCSFCKSFAKSNLICSLHNYCDKCSDFIIKNNKAACYDKITGCMNCSGLFGLEETVAINKISQIFYKNAILPSENMQIVENKANIIPNQYESASSDMVIEFEELKIEEQKIENSLNTDNFIVKVSLNNAKEAEVILNDLNRNRVEVREQCFGCERKINSTVYGKCGHGICELCIFFYTYLPVFKEFINIKELPNSRLVYYCKCREEIEVYYPIMKLLKYVADVVEASKAETIGAIYREFIYIHQNRDMFIKYIDYLEGLPCVFQICPDCSRPCFLVNSKIICPWESSHNNSS